MKRNLLLSTAVTGLLASLSAAPALAQSDTTTADSADDGGISDIVVTASRRSEKMQDVAITVQALGGEQLAERGITNFDQLLTELPQVHAGGRGPGQKTISIRGLSLSQVAIQTSALAGASPTVALYLDDASISVPGRNLDVYVTDLERVEVLEGPQGTLFGASAEGGAIRYITNKPNLSKFEAGFTITGATTPGHAYSGSANGYINIPIIEDKLAFRATAFVDRQGGYIDNVFGSYQMPLIRPKRGWHSCIQPGRRHTPSDDQQRHLRARRFQPGDLYRRAGFAALVTCARLDNHRAGHVPDA